MDEFNEAYREAYKEAYKEGYEEGRKLEREYALRMAREVGIPEEIIEKVWNE